MTAGPGDGQKQDATKLPAAHSADLSPPKLTTVPALARARARAKNSVSAITSDLHCRARKRKLCGRRPVTLGCYFSDRTYLPRSDPLAPVAEVPRVPGFHAGKVALVLAEEARAQNPPHDLAAAVSRQASHEHHLLRAGNR